MANKPALLHVSGGRACGIVAKARTINRGSDQNPRATKRETASKCAGAAGENRSLDATAFNPKNSAEISAANTAASQVCVDAGFDASIMDRALFTEASDRFSIR
jgi:hypothetical protein